MTSPPNPSGRVIDARDALGQASARSGAPASEAMSSMITGSGEVPLAAPRSEGLDEPGREPHGDPALGGTAVVIEQADSRALGPEQPHPLDRGRFHRPVDLLDLGEEMGQAAKCVHRGLGGSRESEAAAVVGHTEFLASTEMAPGTTVATKGDSPTASPSSSTGSGRSGSMRTSRPFT